VKRTKAHQPVSEELLQRVADRLKMMGNPLRLRILHLLEDGELTVSEIVEQSNTTQTNVSKHLTSLRTAGLVVSRRDGVNVYYGIADPIVLVICRTMCDVVLRKVNIEAAALAAGAPARTSSTRRSRQAS